MAAGSLHPSVDGLYTHNRVLLSASSCTCTSTLGCSDPAAMIGYCDQAQGSNRTFYQHYRNVGGHNGHFDFPDGPQHDWGTWSGQLGAMSGELVTTIK